MSDYIVVIAPVINWLWLNESPGYLNGSISPATPSGIIVPFGFVKVVISLQHVFFEVEVAILINVSIKY